jgi:hypothetical protein
MTGDESGEKAPGSYFCRLSLAAWICSGSCFCLKQDLLSNPCLAVSSTLLTSLSSSLSVPLSITRTSIPPINESLPPYDALSFGHHAPSNLKHLLFRTSSIPSSVSMNVMHISRIHSGSSIMAMRRSSITIFRFRCDPTVFGIPFMMPAIDGRLPNFFRNRHPVGNLVV